MAGIIEQSETMSGDFEEHLKTYHAFIRFLVILGASTAVTLLLMYFFLAR
ncbi:MAG TPA: aa3-type cytochrome c oxidase subunit IV [Methylocystis sp.]|nr:aa3-type cytochrome c oxidase subunit IV [Methylocystis sp.]